MPSGEAAQNQRYGPDVLDEGLETIDAHNAKVNAMTFTDDELKDAVDDLHDRLEAVDDLPEFQQQMTKSLSRLQGAVEMGDLNGRRLRAEIGELQDVIATTYAQEQGNRKAIVGLAKAFDGFCRNLAAIAERATPPSRNAGVAALAKSLLPPGTSLADQVRAAQLLKSWFGSNGGQQVAYSSELCSRLRLSKSITSEQEARWRRSGRLPDWINVDDTSKNARVEWQSDAQKAVGHLLAQVSPLYLASLNLR
jgi:hypothetical protein